VEVEAVRQVLEGVGVTVGITDDHPRGRA